MKPKRTKSKNVSIVLPDEKHSLDDDPNPALARRHTFADVTSLPDFSHSMHDLKNPSVTKPVGGGGTTEEQSTLPRTAEKWAEIGQKFQEYDDKLVKQWASQIDTLLVYTGLFCGITATFNIEMYKQLLPNLNPGLGNNSSPSTPTLFPSAVLINSLWFSSMVCGLVSASVGVLFKQWIQHYLMYDDCPPRQQTRVRQYRYKGIRKWKMSEIAALLPLLLQAALILFLLGLIVFLYDLHSAVAGCVTSLIIFWLAGIVLSTVLPAFFPDCPFKSPQAFVFMIFADFFRKGVRETIAQLPFNSWVQRDAAIKELADMDVETLVIADQTFSDDTLEDAIRVCLQDLDGQAVVDVTSQIIRLRSQSQMSRSMAPKAMSQLGPQLSCLSRRTTLAVFDIIWDTMTRFLAALPLAPDLMPAEIPPWISVAVSFIPQALRIGNLDIDDPSVNARIVRLLMQLIRWESMPTVVCESVIETVVACPWLWRLKDNTNSVLRHMLRAIERIDIPLGNILPLCTSVLSLAQAAEMDPLVVAALTDFLSMCQLSISDAMSGKSARQNPHVARVPLRSFLLECVAEANKVERKYPGVCGDFLQTLQKYKDWGEKEF